MNIFACFLYFFPLYRPIYIFLYCFNPKVTNHSSFYYLHEVFVRHVKVNLLNSIFFVWCLSVEFEQTDKFRFVWRVDLWFKKEHRKVMNGRVHVRSSPMRNRKFTGYWRWYISRRILEWFSLRPSEWSIEHFQRAIRLILDNSFSANDKLWWQRWRSEVLTIIIKANKSGCILECCGLSCIHCWDVIKINKRQRCFLHLLITCLPDSLNAHLVNDSLSFTGNSNLLPMLPILMSHRTNVEMLITSVSNLAVLKAANRRLS